MYKAEELKAANEHIKTIPIRNKDYAQVAERIKAFRDLCVNGQIVTEILSLEKGIVTMKATILDEKGNILATGHAQEDQSKGMINKTSFIENCETSAVGRALANCGFGIDAGVASAEEVQNAIAIQEGPEAAQDAQAAGYPDRAEMMQAIVKKYPKGSKNEAALLSCFGVASLDEAHDDQIKAVYAKVTSK